MCQLFANFYLSNQIPFPFQKTNVLSFATLEEGGGAKKIISCIKKVPSTETQKTCILLNEKKALIIYCFFQNLLEIV